MRRWIILVMLVSLCAADPVWIDTNGTLQSHTFSTPGEIHNMIFNASAGYYYLIQTINRTPADITDTVMTLNSSAGTALAYSDDIVLGVNRSSRILFRPAANGTYNLSVYEWSGSTGGTYDIFVQQQGIIVGTVTNVSSDLVRLNRSFSITTNAKCSGGPCGNVTASLDPKKDNSAFLAGKAEAEGSIPVIVRLKETPGAGKRGKDRKGVADAMAMGQDAVISELSADEIQVGQKYSIINGFSARVSRAGLEKLLADPRVESVSYDREFHILLDVSVPLINATQVWNLTINGTAMNGTGQTVCILDTGINYNHPDFGGYGTFPNEKVVGGYDFVNNDNDPMDDHGHGSHVAGIVASMGSTAHGVAPGAKIVMVKVCNWNGDCFDSDMLAGMEWCTNNASVYNITAISMSIGGGAYLDGWDCDLDSPDMTAAINNAAANNLTVVVASGNSNFGYSAPGGLSWPACIKSALSVGATDDSDAFASFTNRNNQLDILAPGYGINSTLYTGGHTVMSGTSMATPHVSGVIALLNQYYLAKYNRRPTPHELELVMKTDGKHVTDSGGRNPLTYARVDALASVLDKGIISTSPAARPFYTTSANPANDSCLLNMQDGDSCNSTWTVVATGDKGNYTFFTIYETSYGIYYTGNQSVAVNAFNSCPVINQSGAYYLVADLAGAPNDALDGSACVNIAAPDVDLDCNGHTLANNGSQPTKYGIVANGTYTNVTIRNCGMRSYARGIYTGPASMTITNCSASNNSVGFYITSNDTNVSGSTSCNNSNFGFYLKRALRSNLSGNTACGNSQSGFMMTNNSGYTALGNNSAYGNAEGFGVGQPGSAALTGNMAFNNSRNGFTLNGTNNTLSGNSAYGNGINGACLNGGATLANEHYYGNARDLAVQNATNAYNITLTGAVFDSAAGAYQNFTNLSFNSTVSNSSYVVNWSAPPSPPAGYLRFAQKGVAMTATAGTPVLDSVVWSWTDAEAAGYNESAFSLWKYNASGWAMLNGSPDTTGNGLSVSALGNFGTLGILQQDADAPVVSPAAPANGSAVNRSIVTFNFIAVDSFPPAMNCSLYLDGAYNLSNASTQNGTLTAFSAGPLADGSHYWRVSCLDDANNTGSGESRNFTVDTVPPNITASNVSVLNGTALGAQLSATDATSGVANWSVNDSRFAINASGFLSNATALQNGTYGLNVTATDAAGNAASAAITVNVTMPPSIVGAYALPAAAYNGTAISLFINASDTWGVWAEITLPNASVANVTLANGTNTSFNDTAQPGTYAVAFHANGSLGSMANASGSFSVFAPVQFSMQINSSNGTGLNSNFTAWFNGTQLNSSASADGNMSTQVYGTLLDFDIYAYAGWFRALIRGINSSSETGKQFGADMVPAATGYIGGYGISSGYSFSNATLYLYYGNFTFGNEATLSLQRCADWNFTNRTCNGTWANVTAVQNTSADTFTCNASGFSAFVFVQNPWCGDTVCNADETCATCAADCGSCTPSGGTGTGGSSGGGGGGGGSGGAGGGSARAKRNITLETAAIAGAACEEDADCGSSEACLGGACRQLTGTCGKAANHTWQYYQCCSDGECAAGMECRANKCAVKPQPYVPPMKTVNATAASKPAAPQGADLAGVAPAGAAALLGGAAAGAVAARIRARRPHKPHRRWKR